MLTVQQRLVKRSFDVVFSLAGLAATGWLIVIAYILATIDTGKSGLFRQARVGLGGRLFNVMKIRTMRDNAVIQTSVTTRDDPRITPLGCFFRRTKIDELPQLVNVLLGEMSIVGPRPEVPPYALDLEGDDRVILSVRPGITGPATLKYRREEELLAQQRDPDWYNDEVIFPDKVRINKEYVSHYSFWTDLRCIWETVFGTAPSPAEIEQRSDRHDRKQAA